MKSISRRDALRALSAAASGAVGGCFSLGSTATPEPAFYYEEVFVINFHDEPHTLALDLFRDGDLVYEATVDTEPVEYGPSARNGVVLKDLPTEPAIYKLYGTLESENDTKYIGFLDFDRVEATCLHVRVDIGTSTRYDTPAEVPEFDFIADPCND